MNVEAFMIMLLSQPNSTTGFSLSNQPYFIFYIAMVAVLFSVNRAPHPPSRGGVSLTVPVLMPVCQGCLLCHLSQDFHAVF